LGGENFGSTWWENWTKQQWKYEYLALSYAGRTVDFLLRANRDKATVQRCFARAIDQNGAPETVNVDKIGARLAALQALHTDPK